MQTSAKALDWFGITDDCLASSQDLHACMRGLQFNCSTLQSFIACQPMRDLRQVQC